MVTVFSFVCRWIPSEGGIVLSHTAVCHAKLFFSLFFSVFSCGEWWVPGCSGNGEDVDDLVASTERYLKNSKQRRRGRTQVCGRPVLFRLIPGNQPWAKNVW